MNRNLAVGLASFLLLAGTSTAALAQSGLLSGTGAPAARTGAPSGESGPRMSGRNHLHLVNSASCRAMAKVATRGAPQAESAHQKGC
jgi:hypothetical protein